MAQLTIYIDDETARRLDERARREGKSRSAWASTAIRRELEAVGTEDDRQERILLETFGAWKDERSAEEIIEDIEASFQERERPELE
jgi:predicted transcriptional regulator